MADDDDGLVIEPGQAADQRVVVGVHPIAVQLLKVREALVDVVERVRPLRMARELGDLPCGQVGEDAARQRLALVPEARDLLADIELGVLADELEGIDARLELGDRLFKLQEFQIHSHSGDRDARTLTDPLRSDKHRA